MTLSSPHKYAAFVVSIVIGTYMVFAWLDDNYVSAEDYRQDYYMQQQSLNEMHIDMVEDQIDRAKAAGEERRVKKLERKLDKLEKRQDYLSKKLDE